MRTPSYADDFDRAMAVAEARARDRRRGLLLGIVGVLILVVLGLWIVQHGRKLEPIDSSQQVPRIGCLELSKIGTMG